MIKYRKLTGYKYQLIEDYGLQTDIRPADNIETHFILLLPSGFLRIRKGYAWNGCSGPTWDDDSNARAGLVHDCLYQLIREGYLVKLYKDYADRLFYEILLEDGMHPIRAKYYYMAVKLFGKYALKNKGDKT